MFHLIVLAFLAFTTTQSSKLPDDCGTNGKLFNEFSWRITGGQPSASGEWPWMVLTKRSTSINGETVIGRCGATIINEDWILTAAHCVNSDSEPKDYTVYMGYNDLEKLDGNQLQRSVNKIVKHEKWNYDLQIYDIALVKINETIDFKKYKFLHPVCVPNITNEINDKCYATGFGSLDENGPNSKKLMKVSEPIYDITNCTKKMEHVDKDRNLCAGGSSKGGLGTCKGDSGGPLQCQSSNGKWYQIGIISWGDPCAHPGEPDVFTRVAYFRDWIEKVLDEN